MCWTFGQSLDITRSPPTQLVLFAFGPWRDHMGFADDLILVRKTEKVSHNMYNDLCAAIRPWKFQIKEEKLAPWRNYRGPCILIGGRRMVPETDKVFLAVMLASQTKRRGRLGELLLDPEASGHEGHSKNLRLLRLRADMAPVLLRGCSSWHPRKDSLD